MTDNQKRDHQIYFVEGGDPGFSPERNQEVIEATIKKYEAMRKRKTRQFHEELDERVDAVASYLRHVAYGKSTPVEQYFGRKELARLQSRKIVGSLQEGGAIKLTSLD